MKLDLKTSSVFMAYLASGLLGALAFHIIGLPAAELSGAVVFTVLLPAGVKQKAHKLPSEISQPAYIIIGMAMGANINSELLEHSSGLRLLTVLGLIVVVLSIVVFGTLYVKRVKGWSKEEAVFSSLPGALGMVTVLAEERGVPMKRIMVVQFLRLFLLVAVVPWFLQGVFGGGYEANTRQIICAEQKSDVISILKLSIALVVCSISAFGAAKLKMPAGFLTGAFLSSALLSITGALSFQLPVWLEALSYILLGTAIGMGLGRVSFYDVRSALKVSLIVFGMSVGVSAIGAYFISTLISLPFGTVFLAYAPGGMEGVFLIAAVMGVDPMFVASHQLIRYFGILILLPLFLKYYLR